MTPRTFRPRGLVLALLLGLLGWLALALLVVMVLSLVGCEQTDVIPQHRERCESAWFVAAHPCECASHPTDLPANVSPCRCWPRLCDDEGRDGSRGPDGGLDPPGTVLHPADTCDDCEAATAEGCDDNGGDCTDAMCGTTRTESYTGKVYCARDCSDGTVYRVTCEGS